MRASGLVIGNVKAVDAGNGFVNRGAREVGAAAYRPRAPGSVHLAILTRAKPAQEGDVVTKRYEKC